MMLHLTAVKRKHTLNTKEQTERLLSVREMREILISFPIISCQQINLNWVLLFPLRRRKQCEYIICFYNYILNMMIYKELCAVLACGSLKHLDAGNAACYNEHTSAGRAEIPHNGKRENPCWEPSSIP